MIDLVRKRHDGDGWLVFTELGNAPGLNASRWADAMALGVWASTKYEAHLYEFKISREDLKRELRDPSKANAVGKYCSYWWLVVSDESVLRDLVVPDVWGILIPKVRGGSKILTVHRKAPKLPKPRPLDAAFVISMVRNMAKRWKSNVDYDRMREELLAKLEERNIAAPPDEAQKDAKIIELERKLKRIEEAIDDFATEAGVDLSELKMGTWGGRTLGRAFKVAKEIDRRIASGDLGAEVAKLSSFAQILEGTARELADAAVKLRGIGGIVECDESCRSRSRWGKGQCSCGAQALSEVERKLAADVRSSTEEAASDRDDDPGGRVDCGDAGAPEQDAGLELRDQRPEVPHGQPTP